MFIDKEQINHLDRKFRLNLINSITGIKPANLIGSQSPDGLTNLAIFSSVVHLGSDPALIGMIVRPDSEVARNTFDNIKATGYYTINHVPLTLTRQAHYTSAKFPADISEFDRCAIDEEYLKGFPAPFVKDSYIKFGLKHVQSIPIELNGTTLVIGEIQLMVVPDYAVNELGYIDLQACDTTGVAGLNQYYCLSKEAEYPYVRLEEVPEF
ncbi:flavin oxidoreductase [Kangiella profundi]|uniref:Flavin oxidoreductase n=1 Tax=Kangiella profundi TaxID=1561924 RepID=A0A2K9A8Q4_9GAMM|nr:flavin reductase [Kangiella profundi]AUD79110.1 flavin oxidoreductase [Kangiella profundi]GGF01372.1 flavin oxidoreductase [Kangiella profundi]